MSKINQGYINHVVFVIDRSGSMAGLSNEVIKVFDSQVEFLAKRSKELDQETRVSVYLFNGAVECIIYDKDVLRLPSLKNYYSANGSTALIDGALKAITDLQLTPELYGDHAFLVYVLTDGQNTDNASAAPRLQAKISSLKDNWTLAVMVPDQTGVFEAKKYGFPPNNIQVWATDNKGIREVGETLKTVTSNYMSARSTGVRGTKSLFALDATNLKTAVVKGNLVELKPSEYMLLSVHNDSVIKTFCESWTKETYRPGSAYFQLTKPEKLQNYKQICVFSKRDGKIFAGANARQILGLPDKEVKVSPTSHPEFEIFAQSTSSNRKLLGGTKLLIIK